MDKNKQFYELLQRAIIFALLIIALIFIMAFTVFKDSPEINIHSITLEKQIYDTVPESEKLDINKASREELTKLNGIGEVLSARIIDYRETHGGFKSIEELLYVEGISNNTFEKIKPYIKTEDP